MRKGILVIGCVLAVLAACGKKSNDEKKAGVEKPAAAVEPGDKASESTPAPAPAAPAAAKPEVLPEKHYATVDMMFKTIVGGKLVRAKAVAQALPVYLAREGGNKEVWAKQLAAIDAAAKEGAAAKDLLAAGQALGKILTQCDACHLLESTKIEMPPLEEPKKGDVKRHGWGAMRMYLGLSRHDLVAFSKGAQELETAPFYDDETKALLGEEDFTLEKTLRAFAFEANEVDDRGMVFGNMIGQCSGCHATLAEKAPKKPAKKSP